MSRSAVHCTKRFFCYCWLWHYFADNGKLESRVDILACRTWVQSKFDKFGVQQEERTYKTRRLPENHIFQLCFTELLCKSVLDRLGTFFCQVICFSELRDHWFAQFRDCLERCGELLALTLHIFISNSRDPWSSHTGSKVTPAVNSCWPFGLQQSFYIPT